ncbi:MAG: hypothetical protein AB7J35_09165 [Dehalococcoidia bacterium]
MERIHIRRLVLATVVGALTLIPIASASAGSNAGERQELVPGRGFDHVAVLPALLPNSKENTSSIAQNNGNAPATIVMDIYTPQGVQIPSATVVFANVPAGGTRVFAQALNTGLTPGFRGVGVISSDQPINALLVRDIESNTFAKSYSIHNAYPTGGTKIALPYVANALDATYNTRFAIANTGNAEACVTILYTFPGGAKSPVTDAGSGSNACAGGGYKIPVGGQISFAPNAVDGAIPMPAATSNAIMAATVTSTGSTITVGVDAYLSGGLRKLASYDGFIVGGAGDTTDDVGTTIAIPLAIKLDGYYSQILLSNANAATANATITYVGNTGTYVVPLTIAANGTASHSVYEAVGGIPEGFIGAATITSDQPLAAVLFRSKMTSPGSYIDEDLYTAVNGVPTDRATTTAKFPLIFRRAYAGGGLFGYNTWVSIIVANGGTANLTITAINDTSNSAPGCSAAATYVTNITITNSDVLYQNLDTKNGFGQAPGCFWGGMTITSDVPIIAIADATNDLNVGDNDGLYNAFSN